MSVENSDEQFEEGQIDESRMNRLFEGLFGALAPNLIVQFNVSAPGSMTTEEMVVYEGWDGEELLLRTHLDTYYKLKNGAEGLGLYGETDGHFIDHYAEVTTIEVVGVGN